MIKFQDLRFTDDQKRRASEIVAKVELLKEGVDGKLHWLRAQVPSSNNGKYLVCVNGWDGRVREVVCTCKAGNGHVPCYHVKAVLDWLRQRKLGQTMGEHIIAETKLKRDTSQDWQTIMRQNDERDAQRRANWLALGFKVSEPKLIPAHYCDQETIWRIEYVNGMDMTDDEVTKFCQTELQDVPCKSEQHGWYATYHVLSRLFLNVWQYRVVTPYTD